MRLKPKSVSSLTLLAVSSSLVLSCQTPPNVPVCVNISEGTGWCTYTISEQEFFVNDDPKDSKRKYFGKNWSEVRQTSLVMPAKSWASMKAYLLNQCKRHAQCSQDLQKWQRKSSSVDKKIGD